MPTGEPSSVVILSSGNLFADGVANRLRQYDNGLIFYKINPQDFDYLNQIEKFNPVTVILNATEKDPHDHCLLCDLLTTFPNLDIFRLSEEPETVQFIRNRECYMEKVQDLVELIRQSQSES